MPSKASVIISYNYAVSPVMAVILMVAITVIMAAVIMNWSSGITAPKIPKSISIHITRHDIYNGTITIVSIKPPGTRLQSFTVMNETTVLTAQGEPLEGFGTGDASPGGAQITVGDTLTATIFGKFDEHMVVATMFDDGEELFYNAAV